MSRLVLLALAAFAACDRPMGNHDLTGATDHPAAADSTPSKAPEPALAPPPQATPAAPRAIELTVTEKGFEPTPITVAKDQPLTLTVTRKTDLTCAKDLVIKDYGVRAALPLNQPVTVSFTPTTSGKLRYSCAMGMISGVLMVQ